MDQKVMSHDMEEKADSYDVSHKRIRVQAMAAAVHILNQWRRSCCSTNSSDKPIKLKMDNVTKVFGKRTVINGVSISVEQGEVVGLLGPNGAGKSTTFNILVGLEKPSTGIVELGERDITTLSLQRRARLGIAYMPQEPSIFRGLSVRDNILLILQETSVPQNQHNHKLEELLEIFDLKQIEGTLGKALSGGERRRTELARALASNSSGGPPLILLVDEPFSGVDPIGMAQMQSKLQSLCEVQNMGILITDHNVHETMKICDRAYVVCQGQVLASGTPPQVYTNEHVRQHYLGHEFRE